MPSRVMLEKNWKTVQKDKDGARALSILWKSGFRLNWPEIGLIPFLPTRRARSRNLVLPRGTRLVVRSLREIADGLADQYTSVEAYNPREGSIYMKPGIEGDFPNFRELADSLERVGRCRWAVTEHNPRQNAIAGLLWETKNRTGKLREVEVADLLDAVFRAAGKKFTFPLESLRKALDREKATRMAGRRKLRKSSPR